MSFRRHSTFLGKLEAVLPWVVGLLLVAAIGGGAWWWFGVRRPAKASQLTVRSSDPAMVKLLDESRALEKRFLQVRELGAPSAADLAGLERAISLHQQWMKATGRTDTEAAGRLETLKVALAREHGRKADAEGREAEQRARDAIRGGDRPAAIEGMRRALAAQQTLNSLPVASGWRDLGRESNLGQELQQLEVQPLADELAVGLVSARARLEQREWVQARREFQALRALQLRINREFPRTKYADIAALDGIDAEIESLGSAELMSELESHLARANHAEEASSWDAAAVDFARAAELQQRINREFSRGRFASAERVETLEISRQTALSRPVAAAIAELDRAISEALRKETFAEIEKSATRALGLADQMQAQFPRSRLVDGPQRRKFSYLSLLGAQVEDVVKLTRGRFVPVRGAHVAIFSREIPQALYQRVMNSNPSRNPGAELPVDSAPCGDAEEFARRLSWVLGRPVRLPTEVEFRAAVEQAGAAKAPALSAAWCSDAGATKSRAPEAAAPTDELRDLLGNLAEWLTPADEKSPDAPLAGGSYQDSRATLATLPVARAPRNERARTIGFRVVLPD